MGRAAEATAVFERILLLNPDDDQGVRFCVDDIARGRSWEELDRDDDEARNQLIAAAGTPPGVQARGCRVAIREPMCER